jgi:hypothetical protein
MYDKIPQNACEVSKAEDNNARHVRTGKKRQSDVKPRRWHLRQKGQIQQQSCTIGEVQYTQHEINIKREEIEMLSDR